LRRMDAMREKGSRRMHDGWGATPAGRRTGRRHRYLFRYRNT
jgi:hypothetical protein